MQGHGRGASRREFLRRSLAFGAAALAEPAAARPQPTDAPAAGTAERRLFSEPERRVLGALADGVLPGAEGWGAVDYIEGLLTAFDHDPPRLYPGPSFAGEDFVEPDRVRAQGWRLRLLGSAAVDHPNAAALGPVEGLRPLIVAGARDAARRAAGGAAPDWTWWRLPAAFRDAFTELVLEASLGDPLYGGNRDAAGWRAFHFEGTPLGYGSHGSAAHGAAPDPDRLGPFTRAALWVLGFFSRRWAG